jgi:hypothetical protein
MLLDLDSHVGKLDDVAIIQAISLLIRERRRHIDRRLIGDPASVLADHPQLLTAEAAAQHLAAAARKGGLEHGVFIGIYHALHDIFRRAHRRR